MEKYKDYRNLVDEPITFVHPNTGWNVWVSFKGHLMTSHMYLVKINGKLVQDMPRPDASKKIERGVRKSTKSRYEDDLIM